MPQNIFPVRDRNGVTLSGRGDKVAANLTAAAVIKTGRGRVGRISIIAPGSTSGAWTLHDAATVGAATAANRLWTLPYNGGSNVAGTVIDIDLPFTNGLVLAAVPGGGSPQAVVSYR
ncbi:MAG: hypothetical protein N2444_00070 [Methylocystis sp.]|nr:hypothetical protein [Methylocystis sp.]